MSATATGSITGERIAEANGIELAYEELGDPAGEPLLLIMGLATQMIHWDEDFCALLGERGFRVIRFDNRDIGRSSKIDSAGEPPTGAMTLGYGKPAYRLADMAGDTVGLLDHLGIERAHLAGASMGGMIAQQAAIDHPGRVALPVLDHVLHGQPALPLPSLACVRAPHGQAAVEPGGLRRAGRDDVQGDRVARRIR